MTVSSFASLSLNPLLVTVSINRSSPFLEYVRSAEAFAVSVLASDQQQVAAYFAARGRTPEPAGFATVPTTAEETGAPIIDGCLSWFDCTVEDLLPGGDHDVLVGRVAAAGGRTGEPLVYWAGGYRALTEASSDRLARVSDGLAVAYHLLDVSPDEMLDAQSSVEPVLAALAATRSRSESGTGWRNLLINRNWSSINLMSSTSWRSRSTPQLPRHPRTGCCKPPSPALARCSRSITETAAVLSRRALRSRGIGGYSRCCAGVMRKGRGRRCAGI